MKKGHGLARAVQPVIRDELDRMPTVALLARLKRLRWCEESADNSDLSADEVVSAAGKILFKSEPAWQTAYAELREVLASREHVEKKP